MATATTITERPDRFDPWGFGDGGSIVVVPLPSAPAADGQPADRSAAPWPPAALASLGPDGMDRPDAMARPDTTDGLAPSVLRFPLPDAALATLQPGLAVAPAPAAPAAARAAETARTPAADARTAVPDTWALRLPFAPRRIGVLALFGAVLVAQAFYLGLSLTGAAAPAPSTGDVVLSSHPSGARVTVDGRAAGTTPLLLTLPAGRRVVRLDPATGEDGRTLVVDVTAGERLTRHVPLSAEAPSLAPAANPGALQVDTSGVTARIALDDAPDVAAPASFADVPAGEHRVTIRFAATTVRRTVMVPPGGRVALVVDAPAAAPRVPAGPVSGWLRVDVPFEVQVFEEGRLLGTSAADRLMLAAGRHEIVLVNTPLGFRAAMPAVVAAGKTLTLAPDVPTAPVHVNASPWAEVFVAGRSLGETPLANVPLPLGAHTLVFRHPDLGERTASVTVRQSTANRVSVAFTR